MAGNRNLRPVGSEDEKRKREYEDNLRIRTITSSALQDENPDATFSPTHMRIWEVLEHWQVTAEDGLTEKETRRRRRKFGVNIVYPYLQLSFSGSIRSQLHTSMSMLFLFVCVLMYIFESTPIYLFTAGVNAALFVINAIIEAKAASALEVTKKQSSMKCVIRRERQERLSDSRAIVPGDIIVLNTGDIVPADARLIESTLLKVSETPVFGALGVSEKNALYIPGYKDKGSMPNMVYAGSIIIEGKAVAVVCAAGKDLLIRKQREAASGAKSHRPTLLQYVHTATSKLSLFAVVICLIAIFLGAFKGFELANIFVLAVGTCFISLSDTVGSLASASLTVGIKHMIDNGATLRNLNCIPDLCAVDTIMCEHKAAFPLRGIAATTAFVGMREYNIEASSKARVQQLLTNALVCSDVKVAQENKKYDKRLIGSKADVAIVKAAASLGISFAEITNNNYRIASAYNYHSELERVLVMSSTTKKVIFKGMPEFVLRYCKYYEQLGQLYPLDDKVINRLLDAAYEMREKNQRVVAYAEILTDEDSLSHSSTANDFVFVGFVGLYVSLGLDAASAVYKCTNSGIEAVVKTDEPYHIALAQARNAGIIKDETEAIRGFDIERTDPGLYIADLPKYKLFMDIDEDRWYEVLYYRKQSARNVALQVSSLAQLQAMSLADISITVEGDGNETLKQCADVIVQKEGFDVIAQVLIKARMIYKRIHTTVQFAVFAFITFCSALILSIFSGIGPAFRLQEIVLSGVIINFFILLSLSAAPEDSNILKKRPNKPFSTEFAYGDFFACAIYGILTGTIMVISFFLEQGSGGAYSSVLISTVLSFFLFAYSDFSTNSLFFGGGQKNYILSLFLLISISFIALLLYSPTLSGFFGYNPLNAKQVLTSISLPSTLFLLTNLFKMLINNRNDNKKKGIFDESYEG